jgi:hypothetical protein
MRGAKKGGAGSAVPVLPCKIVTFCRRCSSKLQLPWAASMALCSRCFSSVRRRLVHFFSAAFYALLLSTLPTFSPSHSSFFCSPVDGTRENAGARPTGAQHRPRALVAALKATSLHFAARSIALSPDLRAITVCPCRSLSLCCCCAACV